MSLPKTVTTALNKYDPSQIQQLLDNSNNPVTLSYISVATKNPVSVPVWTFCFENKFYIFAGKKSKKVQAIEAGNNNISLVIINKEFYPHPVTENIPYLGVNAVATIITYNDNPNVVWLHQQLLVKYDTDLSYDWIKKLYQKLEAKPEAVWLIEVNPVSFYSD